MSCMEKSRTLYNYIVINSGPNREAGQGNSISNMRTLTGTTSIRSYLALLSAVLLKENTEPLKIP